jgi:hypothetical protein
VADSGKKELGRNEPCHCGSGKKYKACCLDKDEAAAREARQKAQAEADAAAETAAPASEAEAAERPRERDRRQNTAQPWKQKQEARGMPRFNAPRRSGGS